MELFYAMNAFERLDWSAEIYWSNYDATYPHLTGNGNSLNGWFIRDDVASIGMGYYPVNIKDFVEANLTHFNRPGIINHSYAPQVMSSDYGDRANYPGKPLVPWPSFPPFYTPPVRGPVEESQDQFAQLYAGFGMVTKLVPSATYNGQNLRLKAGENIYRMSDYIPNNNNDWLKWRIFNPTTYECVYGTHHGNNCDEGGANVLHNSVGLTRGLMFISLNNPASFSQLWNLEQTTFQPGFQTAWNITGSRYIFHPETVYATTYAAFANNWYNIFGNRTWEKIVVKSKKRSLQWPHLPLVYRLFSGPGTNHGTGLSPYPSYFDLFNAAPFCGTYNYYGNYGEYWIPSILGPKNVSWHWSHHNILQDASGRGDMGHNGDFNNLDYMATYNMFLLTESNYLPLANVGYFNSYYHEDYNKNYPLQNGIGSTTNQLQLNFLEYVSLINQIQANGFLNVRGAKVIDLKPGFEASYRTNFYAFVKDYDCEDEGYYYAQEIIRKGKEGEGHGALPGNDGEGYLVPYTYPPDGTPFEVDTIIGNPEWLPADDLINEDTAYIDPYEQYELDSLMHDLFDSGNQELLDYFDSLMNSGNGYKMSNTSQSLKVDIRVFPNPNSGDFNIFISTDGPYSLELFNALGVLILEDKNLKRGLNRISLPPKLQGGSYLAKISNHNVGSQSFKLTIIR